MTKVRTTVQTIRKLQRLLGIFLCLAFAIATANSAEIKVSYANYTIRDMIEDSQGNIWIGTFGLGLWKYANGRPQPFIADAKNRPYPMISNLLLDGSRLWIATAGGGCDCLNLKSGKFFDFSQTDGFKKLHGLIKTSHGDVITGSVGSGTAIFNPEHSSWQPVTDRTLQHLSWVNDLYEWKQRLWLATNCGLYSTPVEAVKKSWQPTSAGLGEGANCLFASGDKLFIGTTSRGVFAMKTGKQPYPIRNTYGEIYFIASFRNRLIAGGQYGLWELNETSGQEIAKFPAIAAKSCLVTKNSVYIGTMDGKIIGTEDLNEFNLLLNLQQHGPEELGNAKQTPKL